MSRRKGSPNKLIEEITVKYLLEFPDASTWSIARKLSHDHPMIFPSVEDARNAVKYRRMARGKMSDKYRKGSGRPIFETPNPIISLPEAYGTELDLYQIPTGNTKIGYLSDIHFPKHCQRTIDIAMADFAKNSVDTIILNGDLLDNPTFGKHAFDPAYRGKVEKWFDMTEYFLEQVRDAFPNALILYAEGNHDSWYKRYLWAKVKNLASDPYYSLEERLHLLEHRIKWIPETQLIQLADYFVFHGHQHLKGGQLDTAAKRLLNKLKSNCICGHLHYAGMFSDVDILGKTIMTVHISGAASSQYPSYMPFGGKARKGYMNIKVVNGKCEVENIYLNSDFKKIIINS